MKTQQIDLEVKNFSERLRYALFIRKLSQAEAARRCEISQQAINYIIKNKVEGSKLATQIAAGLNISSEWLIHGMGNMEKSSIKKIPVIDNYYVLGAFINGIDVQLTQMHSDEYYGEKTFAYVLNEKELVICCPLENNFPQIYNNEYITIYEKSYEITNEKTEKSYRVCERRAYNVNKIELC